MLSSELGMRPFIFYKTYKTEQLQDCCRDLCWHMEQTFEKKKCCYYLLLSLASQISFCDFFHLKSHPSYCITLFFSTLLHVSGSHYCYWNLQKYILKILVPFCFLWMQTNMTSRRRNRLDDSKCVQSQLCLTLKILTNHL